MDALARSSAVPILSDFSTIPRVARSADTPPAHASGMALPFCRAMMHAAAAAGAPHVDGTGRMLCAADGALVRRLALSAKAIAMLAAATGQPDPAGGVLATASHVFDINGYTARDIAWLHAGDDHVVLVLPGNARPLREYPSLAAMRADVSDMARTQAGRAELASHFSRSQREDGLSYQGVDRWLVDIGAGGHERRIACRREPFDGNVLVAAQLRLSAAAQPWRGVR